MPPSQTRRTHTKSRTGCLECKRRQKKVRIILWLCDVIDRYSLLSTPRQCDEEKPTCSGCAKRSIPCVFPIPESLSHTDKRLGPTSTAPRALTRNSPAAAPSLNIPPLSCDGRRSTTPASPAVPPCEARGPPAPKDLGHFDAEDMALVCTLFSDFNTPVVAVYSSKFSKRHPFQSSFLDLTIDAQADRQNLTVAPVPDRNWKNNVWSLGKGTPSTWDEM
jgi:hypothetical protein